MENFKTTTFIVPSGAEYEIREQNGEDEGILSNQADAKNLMNFHCTTNYFACQFAIWILLLNHSFQLIIFKIIVQTSTKCLLQD